MNCLARNLSSCNFTLQSKLYVKVSNRVMYEFRTDRPHNDTHASITNLFLADFEKSVSDLSLETIVRHNLKSATMDVIVVVSCASIILNPSVLHLRNGSGGTLPTS